MKGEVQLLYCGRQDCSDLHSWGPGMRRSYILHYILRGSGYLKCNGKRYSVKRGQSFAIFPYTTVYYYPDAEDPWEYIWVDFIGAEAEQIMENAGFTPESPVGKAENHLQSYYSQLCGLDFLGSNRHTAQGLLMAVLGAYTDVYEKEKGLQESRGDELRQAIRANYHKADFSVDCLCRQLNCSRVTVYRAFKQIFGTAPQFFLLQYRLRQGMKILRAGASVKEAAFSCGFSDPFYFSRQFKKTFGSSPSTIKKI